MQLSVKGDQYIDLAHLQPLILQIFLRTWSGVLNILVTWIASPKRNLYNTSAVSAFVPTGSRWFFKFSQPLPHQNRFSCSTQWGCGTKTLDLRSFICCLSRRLCPGCTSELFRPYLDYLYLNSNFTQLQLHIQSLWPQLVLQQRKKETQYGTENLEYLIS